jgi:P-type Mg2+ transporter
MNAILPEQSGLTNTQAQKLLIQYGPNSTTNNQSSILQIILNQFKNPIIYLLLATALVSILTGDVVSSVVLGVLIVINTLIGFAQEYQSAKLADKLQNLIKKETLCLRDGQFSLIPCRDLVPGDIIKLALGDVIPADCEVVESCTLMVDESTLTGETATVERKVGQNLFGGTNIGAGTTTCIVTKTGSSSNLGNITNLALNTTKKSEFNESMSKLSRGFIIIGFVFLIGIFGLHLILGKVENWQDTLVFVLALTISIIPEALPIVTSITLSSQALKLGKKGLLVKHSTVLEDLGNMDIFCSDKTGTLTQNAFVVVPQEYSPDLVQAAGLVNINGFDSFALAINEYFKFQNLHNDFTIIPFDPKTRISGIVFERGITFWQGSCREILAKVNNLDQTQKDLIILELDQAETQGQKCLCLAKEKGGQCEYLGTILFQDELKADAKELIQKCKDLKVDLKILTGDSLNVATHIGLQSGLINSKIQTISAESVDFTTPSDILFAQLQQYKIIARCTPAQKFQIIQCLQKKLVVGYLGDGINDAPALKAAQIGIVVDTSSAIAKETADIIMTGKDLNSLILGIQKGRSVYENINKYLKTILSSSFGNFFTMGLLSLILPFNPMLGIQVILSDLITDMPLISLSNDNVDPKDISKPKHQNLARLVLICFILGLISSVFDFIFLALNQSLETGQIQTSWFFFSIVTELLIIFSIRSRKFFLLATQPPKISIVYCLLAFAVSVLISTTLFSYMNITTIGLKQVGFLTALGLAYFAVSETVKVIYYKVYRGREE